jgi:hypothetical protein
MSQSESLVKKSNNLIQGSLAIKKAPQERRFLFGLAVQFYWSSASTVCGNWFACASMAVPA